MMIYNMVHVYIEKGKLFFQNVIFTHLALFVQSVLFQRLVTKHAPRTFWLITKYVISKLQKILDRTKIELKVYDFLH